MPYAGPNLDALQERITMILDGLVLLGDSATPINHTDYDKFHIAIERLQKEAKEQGSELSRLVGSLELLLMTKEKASWSGAKIPKAPYPLMGMLSGAIHKQPNACMLWVPGHKYFYRVIAYRGGSFENNRIFDGNTFVFDERSFTGIDGGCYMVDSWGRTSLLTDDLLTQFISGLKLNVPSKYQVPMVNGNSLDYSSWKWAGQAQKQQLIIWGNIICGIMDWEILLGRGIDSYRNGQIQNAINDLESAIKLNPRSYDSYFLIGNAYARSGMHEKAITAFQKCALLSPLSSEPHANMANSYLAIKRFASAVKEFEEAIKINPDDRVARVNLPVARKLSEQVSE